MQARYVLSLIMLRNRLLQTIRNRRRRHPLEADHQLIAKVDALKVNIFEVPIR